MSASKFLRQSMQNLSMVKWKLKLPPAVPLNEAQSIPSPLEQLLRPSRPSQLEFSYPPRHRHTQFYGFWINQQWLVDLGKNVQYPEDHLDPPNDDDYFLRGFEHINWAVRIDPLTVQLCLQPKKDGAPPEYVDADGEVFVLSVFSDEEADYPARPAQEQVDYLTKVLGRKPRWWVGIWPRNDWE